MTSVAHEFVSVKNRDHDAMGGMQLHGLVLHNFGGAIMYDLSISY
jgi:hypothetical protein